MFTVIPPTSPASHSVKAGSTPALSSPAHYSPGCPLGNFPYFHVFKIFSFVLYYLFYIT